MDEVAKRDENDVATLIAVTDDENQYITNLLVDPVTGRLLVSSSGGGSGSGTVTAIIAGTGLAADPNPITTEGTIYLADTDVVPGTYLNANITVDQQGRITLASNGTGGGGTVQTVSVVTANGLSGTVANPTSTPAITLDINGLSATKIADGSVTNAEFQYINTLTSNAQDQINGKQDTLVGLTATVAELNLTVGGSSAFQGQIDGKVSLTGNENIADVKTFTSIPILPATMPTLPQHAANKDYVDTFLQGLKFKGSVTAATTAALPANTYNNGASGVGATLTGNANGALAAQDGVTLTVNQDLLVKNEGTTANNGTYKLTQVGTAGTPYILTRLTNYDTASEAQQGSFISVISGSTLGGTLWAQSSADVVTMGADAITFSQIASALVYTGGNGIDVTGTVISVEAPTVTTTSSSTANIPVFTANPAEVEASGLTIVTTAGSSYRVIPEALGLLGLETQPGLDDGVNIAGSVTVTPGSDALRPGNVIITGGQNTTSFLTPPSISLIAEADSGGGVVQSQIYVDAGYGNFTGGLLYLQADSDISILSNSFLNIQAFTVLAECGSYIFRPGVGSPGIVLGLGSITATDKTMTFPDISGNVVVDVATQTLTNKTLTAPRFADLGFIADSSGNEMLIFDSNASAVNNFQITNRATTGAPTLSVVGDDASIGMTLTPKGSGIITLGGPTIVSGTLTMGTNSITMTGSIATTGSRVTKLWATDVESTNAPTVGGVALPTATSTTTLTNKRITKRITTIVSSATPPVNTNNCHCVTITALATNITSMTTNLSGTPTNFQPLVYRIKDNGTGRTISWGASFSPMGVALPTTTVANKVLTVGFIYDSVLAVWGCVASLTEA